MPKRRVKAGGGTSAASARRKAFAVAYVTNGGNITEAGKTCGLSAKTAYSAGHRLLKHVETQKFVTELREKISTASELTAENVLREVRRVALFDPRSLYRDDGTAKRPDEWSDDTAAAIAGVEVLEEYSGKGEERELSGYTKKYKVWDKNAALEKAMKHLGLFEKDNAQSRDSLSLTVEAAKPVKR